MKRIIDQKVKKARARQEAWELKKIRWYSRKIISILANSYKKTGNPVVQLDIYKFNENKLIKVLDMLSKEKQLTYSKEDDICVVTLILEQPKKDKPKVIDNKTTQVKQEEKPKQQKEELYPDAEPEEYEKPF